MDKLICPCTLDCPKRTTTCRPCCSEFQTYDAERIRRAAKRDVLHNKNSTYTIGWHKRYIRNILYKREMEQGRL